MVTTGAQRAPLADTKCPPAAQRKQAKRACYLLYWIIDPILQYRKHTKKKLYLRKIAIFRGIVYLKNQLKQREKNSLIILKISNLNL